MKLSVIAIGIAGAPFAAGCIADNCARAVTGTATLPGKPGVTARLADCSSFLAATLEAKAVPSYASACSGAERYTSACSCFGVFTATEVLPTPSVTATPVPVPNQPLPCQGGFTCGGGSVPCRAGDDVCICFQTPEGSVCLGDSNCGAPCDVSADCGPGFVCVVGDCCGGKNCAPIADQCALGSTPSQLFQKTSGGSRTKPLSG